LGKKGSLTSSSDALLENSIGSVGCRDISRWRSVTWRDSFKETLGNKISHFGNSVSLMEGLLMKYITSSRKVTEVALGIVEMLKHVGPRALNGWAAIPEPEILLKSWLASKNDVGKIYHLLWGHWRESMLCKINKIINSSEDIVNREGNVIMHVKCRHFFGFDLLRSDFTVGGQEV
jgi:hypothetical protein